MNHEFVSGADFDRHDVSGKFGREGEFSSGAYGPVFSHEDRPAARYALQDSKEATTAAKLRVGRHLDRSAHPGEFTSLGDDRFIGIQNEFENGHCGAVDAVLHELLLEWNWVSTQPRLLPRWRRYSQAAFIPCRRLRGT